MFGESPTCVNPEAERYQYPAYRTKGGRPSSPIQTSGFGERPIIVPPEVRGLNVAQSGSLAEDVRSVVSSSDTSDRILPVSS